MGRKEKCYKSSTKNSKSYQTLPDYSVEEDTFGRLVNKEKRLVWPSAKQLTCKEFESFLVNPPKGAVPIKAEDSESEDLTEFTKASQSAKISSQIGLPFHEKYAHGHEEDSLYIGAVTSEVVVTKFPNAASFVLYYRLPEVAVAELPIQLDLYMAYKKSNGTVMHFPIVRKATRRADCIQEEYLWRVEAGEEYPNEFTSLAALVKYYRLFSYFDPETGDIEAFPYFG